MLGAEQFKEAEQIIKWSRKPDSHYEKGGTVLNLYTGGTGTFLVLEVYTGTEENKINRKLFEVPYSAVKNINSFDPYALIHIPIGNIFDSPAQFIIKQRSSGEPFILQMRGFGYTFSYETGNLIGIADYSKEPNSKEPNAYYDLTKSMEPEYKALPPSDFSNIYNFSTYHQILSYALEQNPDDPDIKILKDSAGQEFELRFKKLKTWFESNYEKIERARRKIAWIGYSPQTIKPSEPMIAEAVTTYVSIKKLESDLQKLFREVVESTLKEWAEPIGPHGKCRLWIKFEQVLKNYGIMVDEEIKERFEKRLKELVSDPNKTSMKELGDKVAGQYVSGLDIIELRTSFVFPPIPDEVKQIRFDKNKKDIVEWLSKHDDEVQQVLFHEVFHYLSTGVLICGGPIEKKTPPPLKNVIEEGLTELFSIKIIENMGKKPYNAYPSEVDEMTTFLKDPNKGAKKELLRYYMNLPLSLNSGTAGAEFYKKAMDCYKNYCSFAKYDVGASSLNDSKIKELYKIMIPQADQVLSYFLEHGNPDRLGLGGLKQIQQDLGTRGYKNEGLKSEIKVRESKPEKPT